MILQGWQAMMTKGMPILPSCMPMGLGTTTHGLMLLQKLLETGSTRSWLLFQEILKLTEETTLPSMLLVRKQLF